MFTDQQPQALGCMLSRLIDSAKLTNAVSVCKVKLTHKLGPLSLSSFPDTLTLMWNQKRDV